MKRYRITVVEFGITMYMETTARNKKEAEQTARRIYADDLDCFEDEVNVVSVESVD